MNSILVSQAQALTSDMTNAVTNMANISALLMQTSSNVDWAGFYLYRSAKNDLILGPYQGKLACNLIPNGKGVCGTTCQKKQTQLVKNVAKFPGHIACDSASQSEIVVPLLDGSHVKGVLDLDSNQLNAFNHQDQKNLEKVAQILVKNSNL